MVANFGQSSAQATRSRLGGMGGDFSAYEADPRLGQAALARETRGLAQARADAGVQMQGLAGAGGNPFLAARQAQAGLADARSAIRQETTQELAQIAAAERQRQEAERLRKQGEARQLIGGLLSTGGAVLGTMAGGMGGGLGSSIGGGLGGMLTGGGGPTTPRAGQVASGGLISGQAPGMPSQAGQDWRYGSLAPAGPLPPGGGGHAMGAPSQVPQSSGPVPAGVQAPAQGLAGLFGGGGLDPLRLLGGAFFGGGR